LRGGIFGIRGHSLHTRSAGRDCGAKGHRDSCLADEVTTSD
jgi:hypothetical protein